MIIGDALRRCARNYPDKMAVRDEYGKYFPQGISYSYRQLYEIVNKLGNSFLKI